MLLLWLNLNTAGAVITPVNAGTNRQSRRRLAEAERLREEAKAPQRIPLVKTSKNYAPDPTEKLGRAGWVIEQLELAETQQAEDAKLAKQITARVARMAAWADDDELIALLLAENMI